MRRPVLLIAICMALSSFFVACRQYMPTNRFLQPRASDNRQSTADARHRFDHASHGAALDAAGLGCVECHRFDALLDADNEALARQLSTRALYPGSVVCHTCHIGATKAQAAPGACTTCHENMLPLKPENHDLAWSKVHASIARVDPVPCEGCHAQADCIDCHQRRDSIQTVMHPRNFTFYHSVVARANPIQCGSCHREDFCIGCHQNGKVKVDQ